jgi:hypothetical protein
MSISKCTSKLISEIENTSKKMQDISGLYQKVQIKEQDIYFLSYALNGHLYSTMPAI